MTNRQHDLAGFAALSAALGAMTVTLCVPAYLDNREGHAWCDGAAIALERPVSECMAQWNTLGARGVMDWGQPIAAAMLAKEDAQ